ncbi:FAD binding domain-containing protein [Aspergillus sp. HF37]|nr:FAD binding domain-containing protein [Aspergillus sp. HF37]
MAKCHHAHYIPPEVVIATLEEQEVIRTKRPMYVPALRLVEGEDKMGTYLNEGNAYDTNFQASLWGNNYERLYRIKQAC